MRIRRAGTEGDVADTSTAIGRDVEGVDGAGRCSRIDPSVAASAAGRDAEAPVVIERHIDATDRTAVGRAQCRGIAVAVEPGPVAVTLHPCTIDRRNDGRRSLDRPFGAALCLASLLRIGERIIVLVREAGRECPGPALRGVQPLPSENGIADQCTLIQHQGMQARMDFAGHAIECGARLIGRQHQRGSDNGIGHAERGEAAARRYLVRRLPDAGKVDAVADQGQEDVVRIVGQRRIEEREVRGDTGEEAGAGAGRCQDGVDGCRIVSADAGDHANGAAVDGGRAGHVDQIGLSRGVDFHVVERSCVLHVGAIDVQRADGIAGGDGAVHGGLSDRARSTECTVGIYSGGAVREVAVDREEAVVDGRRAGIGRVIGGHRERASALFDEAAAAGDEALESTVEIVAECQRARPDGCRSGSAECTHSLAESCKVERRAAKDEKASG